MRNTQRVLGRLLTRRNEHPESLAKIDQQIHEIFGQTHAIFVLDMCGFTRLTMEHGITHFLAMIHRLRTLVCPVIIQHGGSVVKTEADNIFAVFPDVHEALDAAIHAQRCLHQVDAVLPDDWDLVASIGIGFGEILIIHGEDFFGNEVNLATKLGEDIAGPDEIFLTPAARARILDAKFRLAELQTKISGVPTVLYRVNPPSERVEG